MSDNILQQQLNHSNEIVKHLNAEKIALDQALLEQHRQNLVLRKHIVLIEDRCRELENNVKILNQEIEKLVEKKGD